MENQIKQILVQRGYDNRSAQMAAHELIQLDVSLQPLLQRWLDDAECKTDFEAHGYSITSLMEKRRMTYPAALLTIDWLLKEPEKAKLSLSRGIK